MIPCAFIPPGYTAVLLGQTSTIEELGTFAPLEERSVEGALVLIRLDFSENITEETLHTLEELFRETGVEPWPGSQFYVYKEAAATTIYLVWQKGMPWLPVIIGLLASVVLPSLLTAGIWLVLPDSLKSFISGLVNMGMMLLMMWLMVSVMKPVLAPAKKKPKQIEEHSFE